MIADIDKRPIPKEPNKQSLFQKTLEIKFIFVRVKANTKYTIPLEKSILLTDTLAKDNKVNTIVATINETQNKLPLKVDSWFLQTIPHHPFLKKF